MTAQAGPVGPAGVEPIDPGLVAEIFPTAAAEAVAYVDLLATTGVERGLVGPRETGRLWSRHVLNSAALAALVPVGSTAVDVGSGAGLPGIPLALARPDLRVTLLEPLLRRATFLTEAVSALGLGDRVRVVRGRAEDHHDAYDVVVSRAVAPLPRLVGWCDPLLSRAGVMLALKGRSAAEEVAQARAELSRRGLMAEVVGVPVAGGVRGTDDANGDLAGVQDHGDDDATVVRVSRQR